MAMNVAIPFLVLLSLQQVSSSRILLPGGTQQVLMGDVCREELTSTFQAASAEAEVAESLGNQTSYRRYEEYSISWTVKITEGKVVADEIAEKYGFTNIGQVNSVNGTYYNFILNEEEAATLPRTAPLEDKTRSLMLEASVTFAEQNIVTMVCSSEITLVPGPTITPRRKRQLGSVSNLRVEWRSNSHARLSWGHFSGRELPHGSHYSVTHAAVIVTGGRTVITYQFFTVSNQSTSFTLRGVSRNNFNIFAVNIATSSDIFFTIILHANVTQSAPTNLDVLLLNSTSVRIQWSHSSQGQPLDRYSIILYNVNVEEFYAGASETSVDVHDLTPNGYYLIIVIAVSGSSYGAVYGAYQIASVAGSAFVLPRPPHPPESTTVCPVLITIDSGVIVMTGFTPNSTATYTCDNGYVLDGSQSRTCQSTGEWTGEEPRCSCSQLPSTPCPTSRHCNPLDHPEHGRVQMSGLAQQAIAYYTCRNTYERIGQQTRICGINRHWSGQPPICQSLCHNLAQDPMNGQVKVNGSIAYYSCNDGFELNGVQNTRCQSNGQWNDKAPTCRLRCHQLKDPLNGWIKFSGITATYMCHDGYELIGNEARVCQESGSWTGQEPTCRAVGGCRQPIFPANGEVTLIDDNSTAFYSCDDSYQLLGDKIRTCQGNGSWSGQAPICCIEAISRDPPRNVTVVEENSSSLRLNWSPPIQGAPTLHYSVSYIHMSVVHSVSARQRTFTVSQSRTSTVVNDLDLTEGNFYTFIVTAVSDTSESSDPALFYKEHSSNIQPPTAVTAHQLSVNSVQIKWKHPSGIQPPIYYIHYFPLNGGTHYQTFAVGTNSKTIKMGLDDDTTYIFTVISSTGFLYGVADSLKVTMCRAGM